MPNTTGRMRGGLALAAWLALAGTAFAAGDRWQPVTDIRGAAEAEAARATGAAAGDVRVSGLDSRVRMPRCGQDLTASSRAPGAAAATITVTVACPAPKWSLYVPVAVTRRKTVVVLTRALNRGHVLTAADVRAERRERTGGYPALSSTENAIGQRLRRPASAGTVLTPGWLETPALVKRGQQVVVLARGGGLEIRAPGEALSAGGPGQQIRIRNLTSGRVVNARVIDADRVEVAF